MTTNQSHAGEAAVVFRDVVKVYHPGVRALDQVSFDLDRGETVALLGPNGAGKSTAIDTMLGLRTQTSGQVRVLGGTPAAAVAAGRRVDKLSGGQMQRVRFALALAGRPDLLFLDEPAVGLDVEARRHFWRSLGTIADEGTTVLFATHYLDEADANASRVLMISQGRVIADGTPADIKASTSVRTLRAATPGPDPAMLLGLPGVADVYVRGDAVTIRTTDADATLPAWYGLGRPIHGLEIGGGGLEEALLALTGTGSPGPEAGAETGAGAATPHADTVLSGK